MEQKHNSIATAECKVWLAVEYRGILWTIFDVYRSKPQTLKLNKHSSEDKGPIQDKPTHDKMTDSNQKLTKAKDYLQQFEE